MGSVGGEASATWAVGVRGNGGTTPAHGDLGSDCHQKQDHQRIRGDLEGAGGLTNREEDIVRRLQRGLLAIRDRKQPRLARKGVDAPHFVGTR